MIQTEAFIKSGSVENTRIIHPENLKIPFINGRAYELLVSYLITN